MNKYSFLLSILIVKQQDGGLGAGCSTLGRYVDYAGNII